MKSLLTGVLVIAAAMVAIAGSFKSRFIGATPVGPIRIDENEFMLIRNFTQDGPGTSRGFVAFNEDNGNPVKVLDAAIVSPSPSPAPEEVINSIVIAGPARVRFVCGAGANCFVTYKIDSN
jgi:hypothetical protein